jgi:glycosyltransferase involved in cell wall biosynthesis
LPEVLGDSGILLDPKDEDAWVHAMLTLLENDEERRRLRGRGFARAQHFTWKGTAVQTLAIYRKLVHQ